MKKELPKSVAVIVAHPDDETLWAGGTILSHPEWTCFVASLCRGNDADRAPKFLKVLKILKAKGKMADLDDGPTQKPLGKKAVEKAILDLLPKQHFDLVISHSPAGEYTRHRRHEEIGKAVISLWHAGKIAADELWIFAYEDGNKKYLPKPIENATICGTLTEPIWKEKFNIITETYGFSKDSWEARATPLAEAFWQFSNPEDAIRWLDKTVGTENS